MAWTPPSDAVAEFTPPQDAMEFTPPSDGEVTQERLARDIPLSEDIQNYSNMPFLRRVAVAPLDILGGVVETAATGIPMLATGIEHGARGLYGKAVKGLTGEPLQQYASNSWVQQNIAPELAPETMTGKAIAEAFSKGVMDLPANIISTTKAALEGTGQTGARQNVEELNPLIKEWTDPALEVGMGVLGGKHLYRAMKTPTKVTPQPTTEFTPPTDSIQFNERTMAERTLESMDKKIESKANDINKLNDAYARANVVISGEDHPVVLAEKELAHLKLMREELAQKLSGDITEQVKTEADIKQGRAVEAAEQSIKEAETMVPEGVRPTDSMPKDLGISDPNLYQTLKSNTGLDTIFLPTRIMRESELPYTMLNDHTIKVDLVDGNSYTHDLKSGRSNISGWGDGFGQREVDHNLMLGRHIYDLIQRTKEDLELNKRQSIDGIKEVDPWTVAKDRIDKAAGKSPS